MRLIFELAAWPHWPTASIGSLSPLIQLSAFRDEVTHVVYEIVHFGVPGPSPLTELGRSLQERGSDHAWPLFLRACIDETAELLGPHPFMHASVQRSTAWYPRIPALQAAIDALYDVFTDPWPGTPHMSPISPLDDDTLLALALPRRAIPVEPLDRFTFKAMSTVGDPEHFQALLPRALDLLIRAAGEVEARARHQPA